MPREGSYCFWITHTITTGATNCQEYTGAAIVLTTTGSMLQGEEIRRGGMGGEPGHGEVNAWRGVRSETSSAHIIANILHVTSILAFFVPLALVAVALLVVIEVAMQFRL